MSEALIKRIQEIMDASPDMSPEARVLMEKALKVSSPTPEIKEEGKTPETEAELDKCHFNPPFGFINFARTLERQRDDARRERDQVLSDFNTWARSKIKIEYRQPVNFEIGFDALLEEYQALNQKEQP